MTKPIYEWCTGGSIDWGTRKSPGLYGHSQPTLIAGKRFPRNGTGSRRPRVRCSACGTRLIVKAVDHEPMLNAEHYHEPVWCLPRHKRRVRQATAPRTLQDIDTRDLLDMRVNCRAKQQRANAPVRGKPTVPNPLTDDDVRCHPDSPHHGPGHTRDQCQLCGCDGGCFSLADILAELAVREHVPNKREARAKRQQVMRDRQHR
jgi:DNA-directed RNA polymerase subunit RPC12/RpoP